MDLHNYRDWENWKEGGVWQIYNHLIKSVAKLIQIKFDRTFSSAVETELTAPNTMTFILIFQTILCKLETKYSIM